NQQLRGQSEVAGPQSAVACGRTDLARFTVVSMGTRKTNDGSFVERAGEFAATRWSVVLAAGHPSSPNSRGALESLCRDYWHPLYAYVRRHQPGTGSDAGVLCGAAGEELCARCKRAARTVPRLLAHCLQTLLVQGMGAGQSPKKGREAGSAFARFRVGRFAMPR